MHDTVIGNCPKCGDFINCRFVSKLANLATYDIGKVLTKEEAAKIDGWIVDCKSCGAEFMLEADLPIDKIKLRYVE